MATSKAEVNIPGEELSNLFRARTTKMEYLAPSMVRGTGRAARSV